jgi:hypothetical protein
VRPTHNGEWIFVTLIDTLTSGERTRGQQRQRPHVVRESRKGAETA